MQVTTYCWVHGTYTLKNKAWVEDLRVFSPQEETYMQTYGYRQNMLAAAHPGYGTYQVGAAAVFWVYWAGYLSLVIRTVNTTRSTTTTTSGFASSSFSRSVTHKSGYTSAFSFCPGGYVLPAPLLLEEV